MSPSAKSLFEETNRIFEDEVVRNRNIDALDRVYTADAHILPPGGAMVTGRDAIKAFWRTAIQALNVAGCRLESVSIEQQGETAYEIGRATLEFAGGGSAPGKYVVIWKREDGVWKWAVDIWNMNG